MRSITAVLLVVLSLGSIATLGGCGATVRACHDAQLDCHVTAAGCVETIGAPGDAVGGELRLVPPVGTAGGRATIDLWEYDRSVQDGSAAHVGRRIVLDIAAGTGVIPFEISAAAPDATMAHYLTAFVDVDGDCADGTGDYNGTDFFAVEIGQDDAVVTLAPRAP